MLYDLVQILCAIGLIVIFVVVFLVMIDLGMRKDQAKADEARRRADSE